MNAAAIAAALLSCAASAHSAARSADCPSGTAAATGTPGAVLCVAISDPGLIDKRAQLAAWIERSAGIVALYYDGFPAPLVVLRIDEGTGSGIDGGNTVNEHGLTIRVRVGRRITERQLRDDWVLVHEMVHLALPELGRSHDWLAEGLATYVEGIARAQAGNRAVTDVWAEYRRSMPLGLPQAGDGGLDDRLTWGRRYWGGALFCLQADVAIREQTANRVGLQEALRAILRATGGYRTERRIEEVLRIGDAATGTRVLEDLYERNRATAVTVDLAQWWDRLGVPAQPASQPFNDQAPLAAIRIALTAGQSAGQSAGAKAGTGEPR
jgi:hypothetical protein